MKKETKGKIEKMNVKKIKGDSNNVFIDIPLLL